MAKIPSMLLVAACMTGCVSVVDVKKVTQNKAPDGISYFLPQVFLVLTPAKDGSMKVEPIYLPDPAHQYSVRAYSVLGNYTIDVRRSPEGFLETVSFNSDTTGMAKQLVSSGATVRATEIEAAASSAKAKAQEDKTAAEKAAAALAAADKGKADAAIAVQVAQAKVDYLKTLFGTLNEPENLKDQVVAAEVALREAQVKYGAALTVQVETAERYTSANAPAGKTHKAPEPMFLKVTMTPDSVSMKPAFVQADRETWKIPVEEKEPVELALLPNVVVMHPAARTRALTRTVRSTVPILSVELKMMTAVPGGVVTDERRLPETGLELDRTSIRIDMPKSTPAGIYTLDYEFVVKKGDLEETVSRPIRVKVER